MERKKAILQGASRHGKEYSMGVLMERKKAILQGASRHGKEYSRLTKMGKPGPLDFATSS
jgi:hypothetical protein